MNGYTEPDERGHDASLWLGTSLHNIETLARAILSNGAERRAMQEGGLPECPFCGHPTA